MGLQNETNEYDAISNKIKQNSQFNLDIIQSRELVVDPLIIQFEKAGALGRTNFCKCIYEFLAWIAIEQFNGVTLTVAQAEIYRLSIREYCLIKYLIKTTLYTLELYIN